MPCPLSCVMNNNATFSPDRVYRYSLWREWIGGDGYCMFVGLNPSTADETSDDPTIRRCIGYAKQWGYSALEMCNLFAYRATDPKDMLIGVTDPVGPANDTILRFSARHAGIVIAAWGTHGSHLGRDQAVRAMLPNIYALKLTKGGHPSHPLYLRADLKPLHWPHLTPRLVMP